MASDAATIDAVIRDQSLSTVSDVVVGEPFILNVQIEHGHDIRVVLPVSSNNKFLTLEQATQKKLPTEQVHGTSVDLIFTAFKPGIVTIPPQIITLRNDDGQWLHLYTDTYRLNATAVIEDPEGVAFLPMRPPISIYSPSSAPIWIGGGAAFLALSGVLALLWMRRRNRNLERLNALPAHEVALTRLQSLANSDLLERGQYMDFYVQLSETIRDFLGRELDFPGLELTTTEIKERIESLNWPDELPIDYLNAWLEHCDIVKFSNYTPTSDQATATLDKAYGIVEHTHQMILRQELALQETLNHTDESAENSAPQNIAPDKSGLPDNDDDSRWQPKEDS